MNTIEKIRAEIDRRIKSLNKQAEAYIDVDCETMIEEIRVKKEELRSLLSFLDTLQEQEHGLDVTEFCKPIDPDIAKVLPDVINELTWGEQDPEVDLEKAAREYAKIPGKAQHEWYDGGKLEGFKAGAEWMQAQFEHCGTFPIEDPRGGYWPTDYYIKKK